MPILMTAHYQVRPETLERCKQAVKNLVEHAKKNEEGTLFYTAQQEMLNPRVFLHVLVFRDEVALAMHQSSEAAKNFVSIVYPSTIKPIEFMEYYEIGTKLIV